jgi:hypothetical protein
LVSRITFHSLGNAERQMWSFMERQQKMRCREATKGRVRAGRGDRRRPMAVWLGRPMSWKRGKRKAILEEGYLNPHKVYSGLTGWEGIPITDKDTEYLLPFPPHISNLPLD